MLVKLSDSKIIDLLLKSRGFINERARKEYNSMLQRRFQSYDGWDRSKKKPYFKTDFKRMATHIAKEVLIPSAKVIGPSSNKSKMVSASSLANFTFCPASYAIQETYDLQPSSVENIGNLLHDKQLLISKAVENTKKIFLLYAEKKIGRTQALMSDDVILETPLVMPAEWGSLVTDLVISIDEHNRPLFNDIASSKLIFHGHNTSEKKMFFNEANSLVGSPDYIFEREDGTRFVVEEKFSFQKRNSKTVTAPYKSHRMQLGTYTMLLQGVGASYGYLIYWTYGFASGSQTPEITGARSFKLESTESLKEEVSAVFSEVSQFRNEGVRGFNTRALNSWKCVNCVTTDVCVHKTATRDTLSLPYNELAPSLENKNMDSVFSSVIEAKPFSQKSGRFIVRNPNGSGFILKVKKS